MAMPHSFLLPLRPMVFLRLLAVVLAVAAVLACCPAWAAAQATVYVAAGAVGGDGSTPERPLGTIGAALAKARNGGTVIVAPGEYRETIQVPGPGITVKGRIAADNMIAIRASLGLNAGNATTRIPA